eukprot:762521-Hanusia_phi.AAC.22
MEITLSHGDQLKLECTRLLWVGRVCMQVMTWLFQVLLLHASGSGVADPGQGVPRFFVNQHVYGSPFQVLVEGEGDGTEQPRGLCRGRGTAGEADPYVWGEGRWVHKEACSWQGDFCGGIESQRFDQHDDDG